MRKICLFFLMLISINFLACSKTSDPELDETPPTIIVNLSIDPMNLMTPHSFSFYVNPRLSSDNVSSFGDLQVRWDFENDGKWDTGFQELASISKLVPNPLPVGTWFVACEMIDLAGNSALHIEPYPLPDWLPVPPDVLAGDISLFNAMGRAMLDDPLQVGEDFYISLPRQDWLNEQGLRVTQRYYIDNQLVGENSSSTQFPNLEWQRIPASLECEGIDEPGIHEIRVELELSGGVLESNVENNSVSFDVVVE